jgi:hypothetical protein
MRKFRFTLAILAIVVMAQPLFACRECTTDCNIVSGHTDGCRFTQDGCTTGTPCLRPEKQIEAAAQYSVASVEVTHSAPAAAPARETARPVVASIAPAHHVNIR